MLLRSISLQHFRNIAFAHLEFSGRRQFFVGANGQGKTNLIEAAGLLTALRSFRGADAETLIRHGQLEAGLGFLLEHERQGDTTLSLNLSGEGKDLRIDGEKVARLGDFLGQFPSIVFSSQDLQLLRGAPGGRRRWLDLSLSAMDRGYLQCLQCYHKALAERGALLKRGGGAAEFEAFERTMAPAAVELVERRRSGLAALGAVLTRSYARIADAPEPACFAYAPDWAEGDEEDFVALMEQGRERDARFRATSRGPHRDDFEFLMHERSAKDFASEGQQRLLVIALRLAQADWFESQSGIRPLLLADDVVGELDPVRRERFWSVLSPESQVMATGTSIPQGIDGEWELFSVDQGSFSRQP